MADGASRVPTGSGEPGPGQRPRGQVPTGHLPQQPLPVWSGAFREHTGGWSEREGGPPTLLAAVWPRAGHGVSPGWPTLGPWAREPGKRASGWARHARPGFPNSTGPDASSTVELWGHSVTPWPLPEPCGGQTLLPQLRGAAASPPPPTVPQIPEARLGGIPPGE